MIQPTNNTNANNINMAHQSWHFAGCTQATFNIFDTWCSQMPEIREGIRNPGETAPVHLRAP